MAAGVEYIVTGDATGHPEVNVDQDTPASITGGGNAIGYAGSYTANASNSDSGSVSAFGSEGITSIDAFNDNGLGTPGGVQGGGFATVEYIIRVSGPTTGALVPVHITANVTAGSISGIPAPIGGVFGYYAPIEASAQASMYLSYTEGDVPVGDPQLPFANVSTHYNSQVPDVENVVLGKSEAFNQEVMIEANFDVRVQLIASASAQYTGSTAIETETVETSASADPTFAIDEPGFSAYTLEGVPMGATGPTGPTGPTVPEPATWAMMLIGFAGLGYAGLKRRACAASQAARAPSRIL
jgi:hypothetical protein